MELLGQLGAHSTGPTQALLLWATRTLQGGGGGALLPEQCPWGSQRHASSASDVMREPPAIHGYESVVSHMSF